MSKAQEKETISIKNLNQVRRILNEAIDHEPLNIEDSSDEEDFRKEAKKLINKKPQNYIIGVPDIFPKSYINTAINNIIKDVQVLQKEREIRLKVLTIFSAINLIIGFFASFLAPNFPVRVFKQIIAHIIFFEIGFMFRAIVLYLIFTWLARVCARALKAHLIGSNGWVWNGLIGLILTFINLIIVLNALTEYQ